MDINFDKIKEIYGEEILEDLEEFLSIVNNNLYLMHSYKIYELSEFIESYLPLFIQDEKNFEYKFLKLIKKLGTNYVELLYSDNSLLEELL